MPANPMGGPTYNHHQMQPHPAAARTPMANTPNAMQPANAYNPPRPPEVFTLAESLNDQIPEEVRSQYNRDENGRIFFYSTPPIARPEHGLAPDNANSGHSLAYLAKSNPQWLAERASRAKPFAVAKQKELKVKMALDKVTEPAKGKTGDELRDWAADSLVRYVEAHAQETSRMREEGDLDGHDRLMKEQRAARRKKTRKELEEEEERADEAKRANYLEDIYFVHSSLRTPKPAH
ncbi:chromatin structure-remodeling complex protein RSC2 [Colletotrichum melonis]|nr:chromatin structure-remodeling complex protein RSC2 [Colletotrichum melonis]